MIDKSMLESIKRDMEKAAKDAGTKYGVEIHFAGGTYTDVEATLKLKITDNVKNSDEYMKQEWDKYCGWYGFKPEHFGATVVHHGDEIRLIGFNTDKPKNCISFIKTKDGSKYMCSQEAGHNIFKIPDENKS